MSDAPQIDLASLADLDKPRVLEIVNGLKINPIVKAVVLGQLKRTEPDKLKILLGKVQTMVGTIQTGDAGAIDQLKAELKTHAATAAIPAQYIDSLIDLVKPEAK